MLKNAYHERIKLLEKETEAVIASIQKQLMHLMKKRNRKTGKRSAGNTKKD